MSLPIGVQVYSVRGSAEADLRGTLAKIKEMGYDGVEFAGLYGNKPADIKRWCKELGLVPISAHVPYPDMVKDPKGVLSLYSEIGCRYVAIPWLGEEDRPGSANSDKTIENIRMLGKAAKELGMKLLYHNHDFEFAKVGGKYILDMLYEEVSPDLLATELDTCWVNVGGENPAAYVRKYSGRAPIVHLKDFVGTKNENMYELIGVDKKAPDRPSDFEFRPVGSGVQNIPEIIDAAKDAGAEWLIVEQDSPSAGKEPLDEIKKSIDYLRGLEF